MAARSLRVVSFCRDDPNLGLVWEGKTRHPRRTYWVTLAGLRLRISQRAYDFFYGKIR